MEIPLSIIIIAFIFAIILSALFSGSETGFISCNPISIQYLAEKGNKKAKIINRLIKNQNLVVIIILIGNNIAHSIAGTVSNIFFRNINLGPLINTVVVTIIILLFGEIIPKTLFVKAPNKLIFKTANFLNISYKLLYPVGKIFNKISQVLSKLIIKSSVPPRYKTSREELQILIELPETKKFISDDEKKFLTKVFDSSEKSVKEIMIPLVDVVAVNINTKIKTAAKIMKEKGLSKLPVYENRIDNIIGIVSVKNILFSDPKRTKLSDILDKVLYVPENRPVYDLISDFNQNKIDIAIVVDEYGATIGLVTLEDIIEEIIGEIEDEFDKSKKPFIKKIDSNTFIIDSRLEIENFNDLFNIKIPRGDYETIGGFIIHHKKYIPKINETFKFQNVLFKIVDADQRKINKIEVKFLKK